MYMHQCALVNGRSGLSWLVLKRTGKLSTRLCCTDAISLNAFFLTAGKIRALLEESVWAAAEVF
jgi:hypothetical protein